MLFGIDVDIIVEIDEPILQYTPVHTDHGGRQAKTHPCNRLLPPSFRRLGNRPRSSLLSRLLSHVDSF